MGRQLLDHVKTSRGQLRLQVYRKNLRAAAFYRREGFRVLEEGVDPETGEADFLWSGDGTARRADPRYARRMDIREVGT